MIYSCYQGVGKSTRTRQKPFGMCGEDNISRIKIDLESSNFFVDGKRDENWYKVYVEIARDLSAQGYAVFVSSHKAVRAWMNSCRVPFVSVSPAADLKAEWLEKLRERYELCPSDKNNKALLSAEENYERDVADMQSEEHTLVIRGMNYDLNTLISLTYEDYDWLRQNHKFDLIKYKSGDGII